jgi:hypothetical protein
VAKRVDYGQEKRQREMAKQKKKQRKQQEKADRRQSGPGAGEPTGRSGAPGARGPGRSPRG